MAVDIDTSVIIEELRIGATRTHAAAYAYATAAQLSQMMSDDEAFGVSVRRAEAEYAHDIRKLLKDSGTASALTWLMERRFPKLYGKTARPEAGQDPITEMSDAELLKLSGGLIRRINQFLINQRIACSVRG